MSKPDEDEDLFSQIEVFSKVERQVENVVCETGGEAKIDKDREARITTVTWRGKLLFQAREIYPDRWRVLYSPTFYDRDKE